MENRKLITQKEMIVMDLLVFLNGKATPRSLMRNSSIKGRSEFDKLVNPLLKENIILKKPLENSECIFEINPKSRHKIRSLIQRANKIKRKYKL